MNFAINITGESTEELQRLMTALSGAQVVNEPKTLTATTQPVEAAIPPSAVKTRTKTTVKAEEVPQEPVPVKTSAPTQSDVPIEEVRAAVHAKATAGKRDELKALLTSYEVARVTDLAPETWAEFLTKINAL